jgi:fructose-1,6-bisphosphatase II / sedoheptulose-1,7-bisphosphatase
MGSGGAPEGVLAARRCAASAASSRDACCSATTTRKAAPANGASTDLDKIYTSKELAKGDCIFAATGVTDGSLLKGVKRMPSGLMTTRCARPPARVVMRARTSRQRHGTLGQGRARRLCW